MILTNLTVRKTNTVVCTPSEDSDQLWHPLNGTRTFAVHEKGIGYPMNPQPWFDQIDLTCAIDMQARMAATMLVLL